MVSQQQSLGNDVRWDGWDIVFFRPDERGIHSPSGARRNNTWGFENRFKVNSMGEWVIDPRNLVRHKR